MVTLSFLGLIVVFILIDQLFFKPAERPREEHHDHDALAGDEGEGVVLPKGYHFHPGHSWARQVDGGDVAVGVDDVVQASLADLDTVELPAKGERLAAGEPAVKLVSGGRRLEIVAPVGGTVTEVNDALSAKPGLVQDDPYGYGWLIKVKAEGDLGAAGLVADESAVSWMEDELGKLKKFVRDYRHGTTFRRMLAGANDEAWNLYQENFLGPQVGKEA